MDKEAKIIEKKRIILGALKKLLETNVYSNITVQDVATESGFSKGGLLHYFPSKEDMYQELIDSMFSEILNDQLSFFDKKLKSGEQSSLTALFAVENFFMDKRNVKILLNILQYSFENEEAAESIKKYFARHFDLYKKVINENRKNSINPLESNNFDSDVVARIIQTIVLSTGIIEAVSPSKINDMDLVKYISELFKS